MSRIFVGIGECVVSSDPAVVLIAPNLGSCLGITVYDPLLRIGAMAHCLLPLSKSNPEKAAAQPYLYVDTGVVALLNEMLSRGATLERLVIAVAGGSNINDSNNVFEIGKKNYTVFRKVLWKNSLLMKAEDVGSDYSRTVSLIVESGVVVVRSQGAEQVLIEGALCRIAS